MPYLIDGHNLIAALPGLRLDDPDDEARLLHLLRQFCMRNNKKAIVYFDRRAPGSQDPPSASGVTAHFVTPPRTADEAILRHLLRLGRQAPNWTVVSSDHEVMAAARRANARLLEGEAFAGLLRPTAPYTAPGEKPSAPSSPSELQEWESLFDSRQKPD